MGLKGAKYTKGDVKQIIEHLLATDPDVNKWHSPKGVAPRKREAVHLNLSKDEYWVFRYVAKINGTEISAMIRGLVLKHFIRHDPNVCLRMTKEVGSEVMSKLFGVASSRVQFRDKEIYKSKIFYTKKR